MKYATAKNVREVGRGEKKMRGMRNKLRQQNFPDSPVLMKATWIVH